MSFEIHRIIFILIFMLTGSTFGDQTNSQQMTNDMETAQSEHKEGRALFPQIEYSNEWQPVGRGDPLKDPTYDYMPPVLDRVRYWGEGNSNKNKNDVLLLGVASKKMSSNKQRDKFTYGPIKRTYYSPPYQQQYAPMHHQQQHYQQQQQQHQQYQQQQLPQRLMPPPKHMSDSYSTSTRHYQQHQPQQHSWKTQNNVYSESRPESTNSQLIQTRPSMMPTTSRYPTNDQFLPTIPPSHRLKKPSSSSPTLPMSTQTTVKHNSPKVIEHTMMTPSRIENTDTTKPLLQSILQTETASAFTKTPSHAYQIEYTSNIFSPEDINSMAAASSSKSTTFTPTKPTMRPMSMKITTTASTPMTTEQLKVKENYVQPESYAGWPVYNLIIEGHSKVKNYGLKNEDEIESNLPKIRPVQGKENPIVERVTKPDEGPEFNVKHLQAKKKVADKHSKSSEHSNTSAMTSMWNLFGNFLSDVNPDKSQLESENKVVKLKKDDSERRKTRRSVPESEREFIASFQVEAEEDKTQPQLYRKGTVISEQLWPLKGAEISR